MTTESEAVARYQQDLLRTPQSITHRDSFLAGYREANRNCNAAYQAMVEGLKAALELIAAAKSIIDDFNSFLPDPYKQEDQARAALQLAEEAQQ